jgi:hypothetical protein
MTSTVLTSAEVIWQRHGPVAGDFDWDIQPDWIPSILLTTPTVRLSSSTTSRDTHRQKVLGRQALQNDCVDRRRLPPSLIPPAETSSISSLTSSGNHHTIHYQDLSAAPSSDYLRVDYNYVDSDRPPVHQHETNASPSPSTLANFSH